MKIDSTSFKTPPLRAATTPQKPTENTGRAAETAGINAPAAGAAQRIEKSPVNASRINEIKEAISQGRFKINPDAIADGLIQTARDLVNSQRKA